MVGKKPEIRDFTVQDIQLLWKIHSLAINLELVENLKFIEENLRTALYFRLRQNRGRFLVRPRPQIWCGHEFIQNANQKPFQQKFEAESLEVRMMSTFKLDEKKNWVLETPTKPNKVFGQSRFFQKKEGRE